MSKSFIKAPQKALQSSWRDEVFRKPKSIGMIKKSKGRNPQAICKVEGSFLPTNNPKGSYEY